MSAMQNPSFDHTDFGNKRFLIVDDFDGMRNILRELLRRCGARQIDTAANGNDAISTMSRNRYDVVLCDYYLGPGKNGQQVLEEARHAQLIGPATIWAMITAEKTSDMVMGAVEHQPDDYLIKPLTEAMLQTRLSRVAQRKAALAAIEGAVRAKQFLKAIELCDQRMKEDGGRDMQVVRLRCEMLVAAGNYDEAKASYERQLAKRETPWAMVGLAKLHYREGKFARARDLLEQVLESNRAYLEGYDWLAKTLQQLEEWRPAQGVLQRALTLSPNSPGRQEALGDISFACRDWDTAAQAYRKAVGLAQNSNLRSAQPYLGLAKVHVEKGDTKEALEVLGRLTQDVQSESAQVQAKAAEVQVHHKSGNLELARQSAQDLLTRMESGAEGLPPAAALEVAASLMTMGETAVGSRMIQNLVRNNHEDQGLLVKAQAVYNQSSMAEEGAQLLEATRKASVEIMDRGVRQAKAGDLAGAIETLREARVLMPNNGRLLLNLAYLLITQQEKTAWHHAQAQEARRCIDNARRHGADSQRCGQLLARLEKLE